MMKKEMARTKPLRANRESQRKRKWKKKRGKNVWWEEVVSKRWLKPMPLPSTLLSSYGYVVCVPIAILQPPIVSGDRSFEYHIITNSFGAIVIVFIFPNNHTHNAKL